MLVVHTFTAPFQNVHLSVYLSSSHRTGSHRLHHRKTEEEEDRELISR